MLPNSTISTGSVGSMPPSLIPSGRRVSARRGPRRPTDFGRAACHAEPKSGWPKRERRERERGRFAKAHCSRPFLAQLRQAQGGSSYQYRQHLPAPYPRSLQPPAPAGTPRRAAELRLRYGSGSGCHEIERSNRPRRPSSCGQLLPPAPRLPYAFRSSTVGQHPGAGAETPAAPAAAPPVECAPW